ncbi:MULTISPECIES: hypothetical protein [Klebsiella pneumoniae complex]|uniref:hypothetical protein n=1 Tax=Klebsiella pneumoniae complex TaxID=3390273 RepID=UPI001330AD47|nr:hypothetical protein [Klebsiella pneumoniae]EIX9215921.1 hypothetical protein [Klebsiella pneumoniae]MCJ5928787.1 hypothetical protein [Klebsiella pneumoniae]MCP3094038.1 hypothetical protein [Klebsiella pneumoniae]MDE4652663.1 hypothetical protein [Klebsiella pneumoniae]HCA9820983.1 hypothetical protein [Klebsiella pneumoniae]
MTDAELAHTKELAFWMTERVFMNPISAKFLNEDWRKAFPDEVAVAERMKALVEALEKAQQRIAELESRTVTVKLPHRNLGHEKLFLLCPFPYYDAEDMEKALAAAGIKVEAE